MSEGTVLIEGKEYISSDRAAKLVGYTKDYVGQLARAGKIEAKRIGRSWYISQDSINKHKLSVHYTLTKPKKPIKRDSNDDEKPSIHIDNSPNGNLSSKESVSTYHDDDFNLLPPLKEKKRDVLLHTDIQYEEIRDEPHDRVFKDEVVVKDTHIKSVPIRKPIRRPVRNIVSPPKIARSAHRDVSVSRASFPVDGVVDGIRIPEKKTYIQPPSKRVEREISEPRIIIETPSRKERYTDNENSKIIPVVGAIIVFTIFVVVYLFISAN